MAHLRMHDSRLELRSPWPAREKLAHHRFTLDAFGARTQALRADRRTLGSP
jgi:hypothetical protein